jgi:hypothetical protein
VRGVVVLVPLALVAACAAIAGIEAPDEASTLRADGAAESSAIDGARPESNDAAAVDASRDSGPSIPPPADAGATPSCEPSCTCKSSQNCGTITCSGPGPCVVQCEASSICTVDCRQSRCDVKCGESSNCTCRGNGNLCTCLPLNGANHISCNVR